MKEKLIALINQIANEEKDLNLRDGLKHFGVLLVHAIQLLASRHPELETIDNEALAKYLRHVMHTYLKTLYHQEKAIEIAYHLIEHSQSERVKAMALSEIRAGALEKLKAEKLLLEIAKEFISLYVPEAKDKDGGSTKIIFNIQPPQDHKTVLPVDDAILLKPEPQ